MEKEGKKGKDGVGNIRLDFLTIHHPYTSWIIVHLCQWTYKHEISNRLIGPGPIQCGLYEIFQTLSAPETCEMCLVGFCYNDS
jgi:hypothetical protein